MGERIDQERNGMVTAEHATDAITKLVTVHYDVGTLTSPKPYIAS
ncbi:MAG TPA: hypothetical protein VGR16_13510 [Thermomicrobiales bacterium]|nr:hypothetical protein [Thermomicrobiales bacterium]